QLEGAHNLRLLEHHVRLDLAEQPRDERPTRDHEIAHTRSSIAHIATADEQLENLQTCSICRALCQRDRSTDVEPVPVFLLPDELEVNTPVPVEESCDIRSLDVIHCTGLTLGIALSPFGGGSGVS